MHECVNPFASCCYTKSFAGYLNISDQILTVSAITTLTALSLIGNAPSISRPWRKCVTAYWLIHASVQVLAEISSNIGRLLWQMITVELVIPPDKCLSINSSYAIAVCFYALYHSLFSNRPLFRVLSLS